MSVNDASCSNITNPLLCKGGVPGKNCKFLSLQWGCIDLNGSCSQLSNKQACNYHGKEFVEDSCEWKNDECVSENSKPNDNKINISQNLTLNNECP